MSDITTLDDQYVSVAQAAAVLGVTQAEVSDLLRRNEIESRTLILRRSLNSFLMGRFSQ